MLIGILVLLTTLERAPALSGLAAYQAAAREFDWERAKEALEAWSPSEPKDQALKWFLTGNTEMKQGLFPLALLAYRRASALAPGDPDLATNQRLVERELGVLEPRPRSTVDLLRVWIRERGRWAALCAASLQVLGLGLILRSNRNSNRRRVGFVVFALGLASSVAVLRSVHHGPENLGLILAETVDVRSEPSLNAPVLARLRGGETLEITHEGPRWLEVRHGKRQGFVPQRDVRPIAIESPR